MRPLSLFLVPHFTELSLPVRLSACRKAIFSPRYAEPLLRMGALRWAMPDSCKRQESRLRTGMASIGAGGEMQLRKPDLHPMPCKDLIRRYCCSNGSRDSVVSLEKFPSAASLN